MAKKLKLGNDLINAVKEIILNTSYPVGRIIVSIDNVNPGTYLGGTWVQIAKGRTLVGVGEGTDSRNETKTFNENSSGGEYSHKLTGPESGLPKHWHASGHVNLDVKGYSGGYNWAAIMTTTHDNFSSYNHHTNYEGPYDAANAHNNVQPYSTVYFWKRTA